MASAMYITESNGQAGVGTPKFASTNSIPALVEESSILGRSGSIEMSPEILREPKARRYSVLDDLRARRDSLFQRARRGSIFEEKENNGRSPDKEKSKDKRRGSDGNRRGSVFYVSDDLLEETTDLSANESSLREAEIEMAAKKGRRKSWHPLAKPPKVDRKRRKGVAAGGLTSETGSTEGLYNSRQKRLSWWNIFVPDSVGRYCTTCIYFFMLLFLCKVRSIERYIFTSKKKKNIANIFMNVKESKFSQIPQGSLETF